MQQPKKVAVIGLDCALPALIEKHIAEGHLPNFKKLFDNGTIADYALVPYPTITPPNWATIATGAWPGTHQVVDFHLPIPGKDHTTDNTQAAFGSHHIQAETIWEAADKAGKKSIVYNFPGGWPSKMKNGIVVGGSGLAIGTTYDGHVGLDKDINLSADMIISTNSLPKGIHATFEKAKGWTNVDKMGDDPLEIAAQLNFPSATNPLAPTTWYVLVRELGGKGYDTVTLSPSKDFKDAFCTLKPREWSKKIVSSFKLANGSTNHGMFRVKLVELSDDADDFRLYINAILNTTGWANPPEVAQKLVDATTEGLPGNSAGFEAMAYGWIDGETWVEINAMHSKWNADCAVNLLKDYAWDLFFMHAHPPDWAYHGIMANMDPLTCPSEAKYKEAWEWHLGIMQGVDSMIGEILAVLDKDTLVVLVSDHGGVTDGPMFSPVRALINAGLAQPAKTEFKMAGMGSDDFGASLTMTGDVLLMPDPATSKALPQTSCHIFVNLKGRDPHGIVEPEDYEKVQQEIIDALYNFRMDGERAVAFAFTKSQARAIGLHGERCGDIVYAVNPKYCSQHGNIWMTEKFGIGSLHALFSFTGPGIKKGFRLQRTCWITDLVPTLCYLLDLPVPEQCEGSVIYQLFEDMNFKYNTKH